VTEHLASGYRDFAAYEATGRSPLYVELSTGVARDAEMLHWLDGLPVGKRQPNLLFAAYRLIAGTPGGYAEFQTRLHDRRAEIEAVMLARRTQTNEPARCALLLPLLAALPQPLALLEVGASAGLCLLPDRYGYDYAGHRLGDGLLKCVPEGEVPLPDALPDVAWRAGLDLNPLDVTDAEEMRWLELLVWPGQEHRVTTLRRAIAIAREDPPPIHAGDLTTDLPALAAEAPKDATLVIFHTAVLAYVPAAGRRAFRDALTGTWIACEAPGVLGLEPGPPSLFALAVDGERVAWADPHGAKISFDPPIDRG
jgi:hypothetical protein